MFRTWFCVVSHIPVYVTRAPGFHTLFVLVASVFMASVVPSMPYKRVNAKRRSELVFEATVD